MTGSAPLRGMMTKDRAPADIRAEYLQESRSYLRHDEYLAGRLPIATGVIDCACRQLVAGRMDITGTRLKVAVAEAVLNLHSLRASDDPKECWAINETIGFARRHFNRYRNPPRTTGLHNQVSRRSHLHLVN